MKLTTTDYKKESRWLFFYFLFFFKRERKHFMVRKKNRRGCDIMFEIHAYLKVMANECEGREGKGRKQPNVKSKTDDVGVE